MDREEAGDSTKDLDLREDLHEERLLLDRAIGGWRGIIDSGLPTAVFLVAYVLSDSNLTLSAIAALVVVGVLSVMRSSGAPVSSVVVIAIPRCGRYFPCSVASRSG